MKDGIRVLNVELDGDDGVVLTFSDGTTDAYVAEELLELRPYRERLRNRNIFNVPTKGRNHDNLRGEAQLADRQQVQDKASPSRH